MEETNHRKRNFVIAGVVGLCVVITAVVLVYVFVVAEKENAPLTVEEYVVRFCKEQGSVLNASTDIDYIRKTQNEFDTVGKVRADNQESIKQLSVVVPPDELQAYHNSTLALFQEFDDLTKNLDPAMPADDIQNNRLLVLGIANLYADFANDLEDIVADLSPQTLTALENGECMTDFFAYLEELQRVQEIIDAEG